MKSSSEVSRWNREVLLLAISILFLSLSTLAPAQAAYWYVNPNSNLVADGKSWQSAWKSPTDVIWGGLGVKAGDTLFLSGGETSINYSVGLSIGASGTAGAPIYIKVGQEPGHNGIVQLKSISIGTRRYIVIDGSRSTNFNVPKSVWNIEQIKSNIGIQIVNPTGSGIYANGDGGESNTVRYVEVGPIGTAANIGDIHGIMMLNLSSLKDWVIEYSWIHDIQNDGINLNAVTVNPQNWDALTIRWCLIERTGDDGIQSVRNGLTLVNSFLRDHFEGLYNGHPDQLQLSGLSSRYIKIINNIMRNKGNSLIIGEHFVEEGGTLGPMIVAGNLFYNTIDWKLKDSQAYGATFNAWRPNNDVSVNTATWSELYLVNNTVYYQRTEPFRVGRASPSGVTKSVWNLTFEKSAIRNNLMIDNAYHADQPVVLGASGGTVSVNPPNGIYYDQTTFPMTNNVIAGPNTRVSWSGVAYANGEALTQATGMLGNTSQRPSLISIPSYDFRLSESDTIAKNKGANLSELTTRFPEFATDLWGNTRGADGKWDIGAFELPSAQVLPAAPRNLRIN